MDARRPVVVLFAALLSSMASAAGDSAPPGLAQCAAIAPDAARLACYDALAGRAPAANTSTANLPAAPLPAARAAAEQPEFGVVKPRQPKAPAAPQSLQAHITSISADSLRRDSLLLDNGQTWVVLEGDVYAKPGDLVEIRRAALGSFLMSTPSRRTYRVHRVQ